MNPEKTIRFALGGMLFEYNEDKNRLNIRKHGISFRNAARVFFDYDRIELYDEENSADEDRFDTIGDISAAVTDAGSTTIGNVHNGNDAILFVVYTERTIVEENGRMLDVTRLISARMATAFERGLYFGKFQ